MFLPSLVRATALVLLSLSGLYADGLPDEQNRLIATGKLWAVINYFHPYLASRNIDWDKALVDALPGIRGAKSSTEYASGLKLMVDQLHDGSSFIASSDLPARGAKPKAGPFRTWVHYGPKSAFLIGDGTPDPLSMPMGAGITAVINLSEPAIAATPVSPAPQPDKPYSDMFYPKVEYRILAAYKLWGAVKNFFAYRDLMDEDWDQDFADFLPKFIAAKDTREYNLAVAAAVTRLQDTNAKIRSADLTDYFGVAPVGLRLRLVQKKPVITEVLDAEASQAGIQVGDIVTKIDGEDSVARIHREIDYIPASTNQSLSAEVSRVVLNGPDDSTVRLVIQARDGTTKNISLKRTSRFNDQLEFERKGDTTKFLSTAIGYVDLERVTADQIDSVLAKFAKSTALIFDLRGTLHFEPSLLASRLTEKADVAGAIVTGPITLTPDVPHTLSLTETASFFRVETLVPSSKPLYKGKTIALVDERTSGKAEHLGLLLEAANNTVFVGSPSAGADGQVTTFVLPGAISVSFSTTDVRHGNSGKLQRLGLQPSQTVDPTVQSVRNARDEVLEKAVDVVSQ